MKTLNGKELAGFIQEKQAREVRSLAGGGIQPKLAIIQVKDDPVIDTYVRLKKEYGSDIGIEVDHINVTQGDVVTKIEELNSDDSVHGVIVQLPLIDSSEQNEVLNTVAPEKDVDGLAEKTKFVPATPTAILWLLSGYNIKLQGKRVAIVGRGALVGNPLNKILIDSDVDVEVFDKTSTDMASKIIEADIVISATGQPGLIKADMIKHGAVVIDAGVAVEEGVAKGDLDPEIYEREDLKITPKKGGVGPLTVCALFENVIRAASLGSS